MKNKKGFTLVELLVSFALITAISLAFFRTILSLQQEQLKNIAKNNYKAFTIVLNNSIQKDFLNDNIEKIISCGDSCYDITYTKNGIVRLSLDKEKKIITYGNIKEKLPTDYKFIGDIEFTSYINSYDGNDSYIALNINVKSTYEKGIDNIKYVYQYDSDNEIIELDVDGAEASDIIEYLLYKSPEENGLYEPLLPDGTSTGIRYRGKNPNNYVYFNCEDKDSSNIDYGEENYNYKDSCEIWRIIGVFDVDNGKGNVEKRIKLINAASTFQASWDSSASDVNNGYGINQWGESTHEDGIVYEGSDLMGLLNGYYVSNPESACIYCNGTNQEICSQTCTNESLKSANMKVLTNNAKNIAENAIWSTYAINNSVVEISYLQEKGISNQFTGKICNKDTPDIYGAFVCNDNIVRTTSWIGFVGLMSVSDVRYADGWLYNNKNSNSHIWLITSWATDYYANYIWVVESNLGSNVYYATDQYYVFPSLYLKSNVTFVGDGNGTEESPYILGINE